MDEKLAVGWGSQLKKQGVQLAVLLERLRVIGVDLPGNELEEVIQKIAEWGSNFVGPIPLKPR